MKIKSLYLFIIALFFLTACKTLDKNEIKISAYIKNELAKLFSQLSSFGEFNGNVLIAKNGIEVYHASFGYANGQKTKKLDAKDRFNIGSIYKEIPAIAIMQL